MPIDRITSHIAESEQILLKKSRDDKYEVLAVMLLGEDGNTARRIRVDSTGSIETTLNGLVGTLQELVQRLAPIAGAMSNTGQLRTVVTGAVTATGGGYVTSAQVVAALLTQTNSLLLSQRLELNNTVPVLSNINNVVIT